MGRITKIINEWDPINLMTHAPDDEYNLEIEMIKDLLKETHAELELAHGIQRIFLETFGVEFFNKSFQECLTIARKILEKNEK